MITNIEIGEKQWVKKGKNTHKVAIEKLVFSWDEYRGT